jgi:phage FluMu protein Com
MTHQAAPARAGAASSSREHRIAADWEDTRCRKCRRLMFRSTVNALRPGAMLERKCDSCNALNYLVGRPDDLATPTEPIEPTGDPERLQAARAVR